MAGGDITPPKPLHLSEEEKTAVERITEKIFYETLREYEDYQGMGMDASKWEEVRRREGLVAYKQHKSTRGKYPMLRTVDGQLAQVVTKSYTPTIAVVGTVVGTLEDEMYGVFVDTDAAMQLRSVHMNDSLQNFTWLSQIRGRCGEDPFSFCGVGWGLLDNKSFPFLGFRDYCVVIATGVTTTSRGETIGYYIEHSLDLVQPRANMTRAQSSICVLRRQCSNASTVEVFTKGFMTPVGALPAFATVSTVTNRFLALSEASDVSYAKKLYLMIKAIGKTRRSTQTLGRMQTCIGQCQSASGTPNKIYGTCMLCRAAVCNVCKVIRKIVVPITETHVDQKSLVFCWCCISKAKREPPMWFIQREMATQTSFIGVPKEVPSMVEHVTPLTPMRSKKRASTVYYDLFAHRRGFAPF